MIQNTLQASSPATLYTAVQTGTAVGFCTISPSAEKKMNAVKFFNYKNIYSNPRFEPYHDYARLVLNGLFNVLMGLYTPEYAIVNVYNAQKYYPLLCSSFAAWLANLSDVAAVPEQGGLKELSGRCKNVRPYGTLSSERDYAAAAIDFLAGMTDKFAVRVHSELLSYRTAGF